MDQVSAFKTRDGLLFEDRIAAERHTMFLDKDSHVELFLKSTLNQYHASAARSIAKTSVINWELWKSKNDAQ